MVGRYPTNKLTGRGPIPLRRSFLESSMRKSRSIRYYPRFPVAIPMRGAGCPRVTQPFATLYTPEGALIVRLACVRRAASVHPEPGSNSPFERAPGSPACVSSLGARRSVQDPADLDSLGFELTLSNNSNFALLSLVDLSIAVSGSQGSRRPGGRLSPARREK